MSAALSRLFREKLITIDGVRKHAPVRRASPVYVTGSVAEAVYFLDSGFVKIVRKGNDGKEVLVAIVPPGEIFGEQSISSVGFRMSSAEMLQDGVVYEVPRVTFLDFCRDHPESWQLVAELLLDRTHDLEQKVSMLCLTDVESRILHYLASLGGVFGAKTSDAQEYSLPLSQSELASLIGATRETTSTTLNGLARRGLLRLGRRLMTVSSADALRNAARERVAKAAQG
jgi:CRP-like cAMP-binding protein